MRGFKSKEVVLSNLITIQPGFQVRGSTMSAPYANLFLNKIEKTSPLINFEEKYKSYTLIQTKSTCRDILYHIKLDGLDQMFIPERKSKFIQKYLVQKNDVLYLSKLKPGAFRYTGLMNNTLPTAHFYILRPKVHYIDSDYLCWALNQSFTTKYYVQKHLTNSALPFISRTDLMTFKVPLPSINIQKKIVGLLKLRAREKHLQKIIDEKTHILINAVLKKLL